MDLVDIPSGKDRQLAIEHDHRNSGFPMKNGDFPQLSVDL